jgi:hypothetical protein
MRQNPRPDLPGSELPVDRLLGPALFFVLGVTLSILGIRGTPPPLELAPERGVASPPTRVEDRFILPLPAEGGDVDWVSVSGAESEEPRVAERAASEVAPVAPAPSLSRGGGGEPPRAATTGCGGIGMPGRSPEAPAQPL